MYIYIMWPISFILIGLTKLLCTILGLLTVPIALLCGAHMPSRSLISGAPINTFTWAIMRPWNNLEDGIDGGREFRDRSFFLRAFIWSAIRNPASGLRFIPLLAPKVEPSKVGYKASFNKDDRNIPLDELYILEERGAFWYFAWQGSYCNFRWQFRLRNRLYRIWIGTKIYPSNVYVVWPYQSLGLGTTAQVKDVTRFELVSN